MARTGTLIVTVGLLLLMIGTMPRIATAVQSDPIDAKSPAANADSPLGVNLLPLADWSSEYVFLNPFKQSRPWITQNDATWDTKEAHRLDLDANGYVRKLPAEGDPVAYRSVATIMFHAIDGHYPAGQYIVNYDGEGTILYGYDAQKDTYLSRPGRDVVHVNPGSNRLGFFLQITRTDPNGNGNYIRNIRIQMPGQSESDPAYGMFHPDFIKSIEQYRIVRFMDWMRTNWDNNGPIRDPLPPQAEWQHPLLAAESNPYLRQRTADGRNADSLIDWDARPKLGDARYSSDLGVPAEVMIALSNTADIDPWFNMPHNASDDYLQRFAELTAATLEPQRRVYIEYSNEIWNAGFYQGTWMQQQAEQLWPGGSHSGLVKRLSFYGKRSAEMCQIWKAVFGDRSDRVVCIISGQANNVWITEQMLKCEAWALKPCDRFGIDALALAPYFGQHIGSAENRAAVNGWTNDADGGLGKLFAELQYGSILPPGPYGKVSLNEAKVNMGRHLTLANTRKLVMLAYEGGQHLVGVGGDVPENAKSTHLFQAANRDARMKTLYADYLSHWYTIGGQFHLHYAGTGLYSHWGNWGAQEYMQAPVAPKQDALTTFIAAHSCPWNLCIPAAPNDPTAVTLQAQTTMQLHRHGAPIVALLLLGSLTPALLMRSRRRAATGR